MYAPHELERTPRQPELGQCVARRRRCRRRLARATTARVRIGQERSRLHRGPPRGPLVYPRSTAVGLHQLCIRVAGGGRHAGPVAQHRACASRAWPTPLGVRSTPPTRSGTTQASSPTRRCRTSSTCLPPSCSPSPALPGKPRVTRSQREDRSLVDGLATGYLEAGQGDPVVLVARRGVRRQRGDSGWERQHRRAGGAPSRARARHAGFRCSQRRSSTSTTAAACGSAHIARGSANRRRRVCTSSAIRWAPSTCSSTPHRNPRCCLRSMVMIFCGGEDAAQRALGRRLYDYDATLSGMRRIVEALFHDPSFPPTTRMCNGATSPALRRAHGRRSRRPRFRRPGLNRRHCRRALVHTSASLCRRWRWRSATNSYPPGWAAEIAEQIPGGRSAVIEQRRSLPADRAARRPSTSCFLDFSPRRIRRKVSAPDD